jgi:hypothetical protein
MTTTPTAGVYMLAREHAGALEKMLSDPTLAELLGTSDAGAGSGVDAVDRAIALRAAGAAHWSVVLDRNDLKGVAGVLEPYGPEARIIVWIDPTARRRGYGTLAVRLTLDLMFRNFQRERVHAIASPRDVAAEKTLVPFGFVPEDTHATTPNADRWVLTRPDWVAARDRPALAKLHPQLRAILEAELAAGNEVAETGGGWPDADSVFVRLRDPFRTKPLPLPAGIVYTEPNDPHWWKADYTSSAPRHTLAC